MWRRRRVVLLKATVARRGSGCLSLPCRISGGGVGMIHDIHSCGSWAWYNADRHRQDITKRELAFDDGDLPLGHI
jgi:hypothetical protein